MRILICDDDTDIVRQLESYISDFFRHENLKIPEIKSYHNGECLLADREDKDIVFLDIEMPGLDGIFVGRELKKKKPNTIIFIVTSYPEYLDDAMRFRVFRYLSKPVDKQRFFLNMRDALHLHTTANTKIPIETKEGVYSCPASEIICVEASGHTVTVHTMKRDYKTIHSISRWEELLDMPCFFRSHRSFIVNMKHVTEFDRTLIRLCDGRHNAYLTKRKYTQFKNAYLLFLESTR